MYNRYRGVCDYAQSAVNDLTIYSLLAFPHLHIKLLSQFHQAYRGCCFLFGPEQVSNSREIKRNFIFFGDTPNAKVQRAIALLFFFTT